MTNGPHAMDQRLRTEPLHDGDFYGWTREQARLLRAGRFADVDLANLIEEIETLGRSEAAALRSSLCLVVLHLLKLAHQPRRASKSWRTTVARERIRAERILKDNPGLKPGVARLFAEACEDGRREAIAETGLSPALFPVLPEFTLDQVRDETFLPG